MVNLAPSVDVADELPPPTEPLKDDEPNPLPVVTAESQEIAECTIDAFEFPLVTSPPSSTIRSSVFPLTPDPLSPQSPQLPLIFTGFASNASVVVGLPALRAPTSSSYIAKQQVASFNSPTISIPLAFMDTSSPSFISTSNPFLPLLPSSDPSHPITVTGGSHLNGASPSLPQ